MPAAPPPNFNVGTLLCKHSPPLSQGIRERGGGLAALNVDTGEVRVIVSAAGAGGGRFASPADVVVIPVPDAAPAADGGRFAVAIFTDPGARVFLF